MGIIGTLFLSIFFFQAVKALIHLIADCKEILQEKKKEHNKQDTATAAEKRVWQMYWDKAWNTHWVKTNTNLKMDIRNVPQLSFAQWLTFYNAAPERWQINEEQLSLGDTDFCAIPTYQKGSSMEVDTFWESPEELFKFVKWQREEYAKGQAAIFEAERAKQLSKLAKSLKKDIAEKNEAMKKELAALEEDVKKNMPKKEEFDPIRHLIDFSMNVKEGKVDRKMLHQKSAETMMQSDGSLITVVHYGVNDPALQKVEVQEIITQAPGKRDSFTTEWRIV